MNFIRTDTQAALNSLLVATRETVDHYNDASELEANLADLFQRISTQRSEFISRLEEVITALGDLPAAPDPDKEGAEMLFHHVAALIKNHYAGDILEQRIKGEHKLATLVSEALATELLPPHRILLDDFALHITQTLAGLQAALQRVTAAENK